MNTLDKECNPGIALDTERNEIEPGATLYSFQAGILDNPSDVNTNYISATDKDCMVAEEIPFLTSQSDSSTDGLDSRTKVVEKNYDSCELIDDSNSNDDIELVDVVIHGTHRNKFPRMSPSTLNVSEQNTYENLRVEEIQDVSSSDAYEDIELLDVIIYDSHPSTSFISSPLKAKNNLPTEHVSASGNFIEIEASKSGLNLNVDDAVNDIKIMCEDSHVIESCENTQDTPVKVVGNKVLSVSSTAGQLIQICEKDVETDYIEKHKVTNGDALCDKEVFCQDSFQETFCENTEEILMKPAEDEVLSISNEHCLDVCKNGVENGNIEEPKVTGDTILCDDTLDMDATDGTYEIEYDFNHIPSQITGSWKEFRNYFTRGCKWAPDGSCILTCSDDNKLRIFNLPSQLWDSSQWCEISEMEAVLKISEGDLIYDYCWYPQMSSNDAATCCLASTSRKSTVHLWDGYTGELRCSYRSFDHMDEIVTPHSLSFNAEGEKLFCGFQNKIRVFDVDRPGRNFEERRVYDKKSGQCGIISCFAFTSSNRNISAAGSYHKTIGIYSEPSGELEWLLEGQKNGVTQLQFSPDGVYLYSGGRKDQEILCWDLRNLGTILFSLRRSCVTNQRMYFDVSRCGKYIVSGNNNGVVSFWNVTKEPEATGEDDYPVLVPNQFFLAHGDCVNGVSLHPTYPLLCSSSGQRKFPELLEEDDEAMFASKIEKQDNSLRLWWLGKLSD